MGYDGYTNVHIGIKTKEGRGSAHYELIWEIPAKRYQPYHANRERRIKVARGMDGRQRSWRRLS